MTFVNNNLDKIIIIGVLFGFVLVAIHATHMGEAKLVDFSLDMAKQFGASLLTLVASRFMSNRRGDAGNDTDTKNGNAATAAPGTTVA
jgi:hypothetical protein